MWRGKASAPQPRQGPAGTVSWNSFPFPLNLPQGSKNPWRFLEVPQTLHSRRWLWPLFQPHLLLPSLLQTCSTTCHLLNKVGISLFKPCSHCLWPTHVSKLTQNSQHSVSEAMSVSGKNAYVFPNGLVPGPTTLEFSQQRNFFLSSLHCDATLLLFIYRSCRMLPHTAVIFISFSC